MSEVILEVKNLTKEYKGQGFEVKALKNISFKINKGEFVVIMGTSGSGKSTLLNILSALDAPSSGTIKLNGELQEKLFKEPNASFYRQKNIGFVFQAYNLLKDLTVEDNIVIPLILQNMNREMIDERLEEILNVLGLTKWRKHRPTQLSGGQQQRVAIGRAIISQPPIILADEPTGNLDFNTSNEVLESLYEMKNRFNQTVLLVTHDPTVANYGDRVLFFHDGEIVGEYECRSENDLESILNIFKKITERSKIQ
ncbi:ABC transporter ATP-binding protein [Virgibacillus pantothenticus]|uniref:ABC transporter ATP-binding protein n=1 Tax=Virgibacillus pantothenticus TaxID=1473 RepID=A0A0L0QK34_VIRPA|nr:MULTISPECIES: ABC transporter ATP-binding protein [Virgibacillus]API92886.1 ABC transporter ATP-binding protein [Virgibacillus sp. 6R]KNE18879.1 ABC transporter ATP-binding protein [Virgibacillus pantothenticus]MBS7428402.1 ABC transporter ATP-binding protein [Virgibacillus sp. 19R1-5]MBU8565165.1 ABC transporter ATP-binding protein [Virgibacillus pantothenticus]MBU8601449.1 ABC transporter ATP-binding protein [Virgibacillus pantothenticus]